MSNSRVRPKYDIYISNNYILVTPCVEITVVLSHINNDIVVGTMISWLVVETNIIGETRRLDHLGE